jgi:hypothetical protein
MKINKYCCRIFPIILVLISLVIVLAIRYLEEEIPSFSFLTNKDEIFNFIGTILFIAIIPIGIFYWLNEKEKYQSRAKAISLLGFLPAILILLYSLS